MLRSNSIQDVHSLSSDCPYHQYKSPVSTSSESWIRIDEVGIESLNLNEIELDDMEDNNFFAPKPAKIPNSTIVIKNALEKIPDKKIPKKFTFSEEDIERSKKGSCLDKSRDGEYFYTSSYRVGMNIPERTMAFDGGCSIFLKKPIKRKQEFEASKFIKLHKNKVSR